MLALELLLLAADFHLLLLLRLYHLLHRLGLGHLRVFLHADHLLVLLSLFLQALGFLGSARELELLQLLPRHFPLGFVLLVPLIVFSNFLLSLLTKLLLGFVLLCVPLSNGLDLFRFFLGLLDFLPRLPSKYTSAQSIIINCL